MNSKGIVAIKDTKNLCYKCLKKKDKVHKINPKYNKAMTLAELYNEENNDYNTKKTSKMGF